MQILPSTLRSAAIRIFKSVARDDGTVEHAELKDQWETTGLRNSDYDDAIDEMIRCELLQVYMKNDRLLIEMTVSGLKECQSSRTPLLRRLVDWVTLERLQWRRVWRALPSRRSRRRRTADRLAAFSESRNKNQTRH